MTQKHLAVREHSLLETEAFQKIRLISTSKMCIRIFLILFAVLLSDFVYSQKVIESKSDILNIAAKWKEDSLGLIGYREKYLYDMVLSIKLHYKKFSEFKKDFGKPNYSFKQKQRASYQYFADCFYDKSRKHICSKSLNIQTFRDSIVIVTSPIYD